MRDANRRFIDAAHRDGVGFDVEFTVFPDGTRTAADAAAAIGCEVAQIVKSLVFIADGAPVMALVSGANRLDPAKLAAELGATDVRQAKADEVRDATGFAIGGTPPFGHPAPLRTLVDRDLLGHQVLWAAAGTPDTCFPLGPDDLLGSTSAVQADLAE